MTLLALLAAAATPPVTSAHLNPVRLFLDADIVVQLVMAGLLLASVWVWTIVVSFSLRYAGIRKRCDAYEREFWKASDIDAFQAERGKGDVPDVDRTSERLLRLSARAIEPPCVGGSAPNRAAEAGLG